MTRIQEAGPRPEEPAAGHCGLAAPWWLWDAWPQGAGKKGQAGPWDPLFRGRLLSV